MIVAVFLALLVFGCAQPNNLSPQGNLSTGQGGGIVTGSEREKCSVVITADGEVCLPTERCVGREGNWENGKKCCVGECIPFYDGNDSFEQSVPPFCGVPKFNLEEGFESFLNSNPESEPEFNTADVNLTIPEESQKCYFYKRRGSEPVYIRPKQQISLKADALFMLKPPYYGTGLNEYINESGDYRYVNQLQRPIPTDLNFAGGDQAVVPFMGGRYMVKEINKSRNRIVSLKLKNLEQPYETFFVFDNQKFPEDSNGPKWVAKINENQQNNEVLTNIHLFNKDEQWDGEPGHNHPIQVNGISAYFLNNTGHAKEGFAKTWFIGLLLSDSITWSSVSGNLTKNNNIY
ncbi:MAG: hypothetical protein HY392_04820, partial [Candidatus Diapherotrites archaeon]|nr:hypothetical protein [Candidatus Diapherotrites archaeon]